MEAIQGIANIKETYAETKEETSKEEEKAKKLNSKTFTCYLCIKHWCTTVAIIICFIVYYVADLLKSKKTDESFFLSLCKTIAIVTNSSANAKDVCAREFVYK